MGCGTGKREGLQNFSPFFFLTRSFQFPKVVEISSASDAELILRAKVAKRGNHAVHDFFLKVQDLEKLTKDKDDNADVASALESLKVALSNYESDVSLKWKDFMVREDADPSASHVNEE